MRPMSVAGPEQSYDFRVDDPIPWRELGVGLYVVQGWFRQRLVSHERRDQTPRLNSGMSEEGVDTLPLTTPTGLRLDGPTVEEWVANGYLPEHYEQSFRDGMLCGFAIKASPGLTALRTGGRVPWDEAAVAANRTRRAADAEREAQAERDAALEALQRDAETPAATAEDLTATAPVSEPVVQQPPEPAQEAPAPARSRRGR
jgi:hypothetical protein